MKINTNMVEILLAKSKMSKSNLAISAWISRQNVSTILGRRTCRPETAERIAHALGVPIEQIMEEGDG